MPIYINEDTPTSFISRHDSLLGKIWKSGGPYTIMFWMRPEKTGITSGTFYYIGTGSGASNLNHECLNIYDDGTTHYYWQYCNNGTYETASGTWATFFPNKWSHFALVRRSSTLLQYYINGQLTLYSTAAISSTRASSPESAFETIFGTQDYQGWYTSRLGCYKAFRVALNVADIKREMYSMLPMTAGPIDCIPFNTPKDGYGLTKYADKNLLRAEPFVWVAGTTVFTSDWIITDEQKLKPAYRSQEEMLISLPDSQIAYPIEDVSSGNWEAV